MTPAQKELIEYLASDPLQEAFLENLKRNPVFDNNSVLRGLYFARTHITADRWKAELQRQADQIRSKLDSRKPSLDAGRMLYTMDAGDIRTDLKKLNSQSKILRRIVLDAKKAMRSKSEAAGMMSDLAAMVQKDLIIFFRLEEADAVEKTDAALRLCRKNLSELLNSMYQNGRPEKSEMFLRLAAQLLEVMALKPELYGSSRAMFSTLAQTAAKDFCDELESLQNDEYDKLASRLFRPDLKLKEAVVPVYAPDPDDDDESADDLFFTLANTMAISLKNRPKEEQADIRRLIRMIQRENDISDDLYNYFSNLFLAASMDESRFGDIKQHFVLLRQDQESIRAAIKAAEFYRKIIPAVGTVVMVTELLGFYIPEKEEMFREARDNFLHLEEKDVLSQIAGVFGLAVMPSTPIPKESAPVLQSHLFASLAMHLLYQDKITRTVNEDFRRHIDVLYEQLKKRQESDPQSPFVNPYTGDIQSVISSMNVMEYPFFVRLNTVLESIRTTDLKGELSRYLVEDILHSAKSGREALIEGAHDDAERGRENYFAAFFLRLMLNGQFVQAMVSPFVLYLRACAIHDWGPAIRDTAERDPKENPEKWVEFLFNLMEVRLNEGNSREQYNALCSMMNASAPYIADDPCQPDDSKDLMLLDDGVFTALSLIESKPDLKELFSDLPDAVQAWILTAVSRMSNLSRRLQVENAAYKSGALSDQIHTALDDHDGTIAALQMAESEIGRLGNEVRYLRQSAAQNRTDLYNKGRKEAEDRLLAENRSLKKQLEQAREQNRIDQDEKEELYQLRELIFTSENASAMQNASVSDNDRARIDEFLQTKDVVFIGGHTRQCAMLRERYKGFRVYLDDSFPASVVSNADLCIVFTNWLSHSAYYKVRGASRTTGRVVPIRYLGARNIEYCELELLKIIDEFEKSES